MTAATAKRADLVLSGGGVKGIGLVGAVVALMEAGYTAQRVSGTSAGSIVGAIVAAASGGAQLTPDEVKELALDLDYRKFTDPGPIERVPVVGPSLALLRGAASTRATTRATGFGVNSRTSASPPSVTWPSTTPTCRRSGDTSWW